MQLSMHLSMHFGGYQLLLWEDHGQHIQLVPEDQNSAVLWIQIFEDGPESHLGQVLDLYYSESSLYLQAVAEDGASLLLDYQPGHHLQVQIDEQSLLLEF